MGCLTGSEHEEQVALFEWAEWNKRQYPELELMFAIPNGGQRHVVVAKKLKDEGVKAGVPDIFLPVARQFSQIKGELDGPWFAPVIQIVDPNGWKGFRASTPTHTHRKTSAHTLRMS